MAQKQIELLRRSLKSHQSVLAKLQKKLLLITAERDSQRQLLENYEKDLTSRLLSFDNTLKFMKPFFFFSITRCNKPQHRINTKSHSH